MASQLRISFLAIFFLGFSLGPLAGISPFTDIFSSTLYAQSSVTGDNVKSDSTPDKTSDTAKTNTSDTIANWRGTLISTEQAMARSGLEESDLAKKSAEISKIRLESLALDLQLEPQVLQIKAQLNELGPQPKDGEPAETDEIKNKRKQLQERFSRIDGDAKAARLIAIRAQQLEELIISNRRTKFVNQITRHTTSVFDLQLWQGFWQGLDGIDTRFQLLVNESITVMRSNTNTSKDNSLLQNFILLGLSLLIIFVFILMRRLLLQQSRKIVDRFNANDLATPEDHYVNTRIAGLSFLRNGVVPAAAIVAFYFLFIIAIPFTNRLGDLFLEVVFIVFLITMSMALAKTFLNPADASRRLALLSDEAALKTYHILWVTIFLIGVIRLFNKIAVLLVSPFEVSIALSGILAIVCFSGLFFVLATLSSRSDTAPSQVAIRRNFIRWGYLNPLLWIAFISGAIALITGYIAFAEFLAWQIMIGAIIFALLWLSIELLDLHRDRFLDTDSGRWRYLSQITGFTRQTVLQGSVFGFGLAKLVSILAALTIFMISWGYRTGDWAGPLSEAFFGFKVGGLSISFSSIVLAILLFIAGYIITRTIQHWLRNQFLPTTSLDPGLRNSIATILGYAGIVLAVLLAVTAAGLDLSKVAIVAGALSVGIGFGLQSIVNNFVSGLILLAERPIKAGDWITTKDGEGTVRKTSVRSTEIETFDGATIIVPNSTLITDAVTNWTHHTQKGRIKIAIGVGYGSDPDQVRDILLECGQSHQRVVTNPAPMVLFQDFGNDALLFELRAYLADINYSASTKSDLRFAILSALKKANIEIPYPQRDIHIKSGFTPQVTTGTKRKKPAPARKNKTRQA